MMILKTYINYEDKIKQNYILLFDRDGKNIITVAAKSNGEKKQLCYTEIDKRGKKASITKAVKKTEDYFKRMILDTEFKQIVNSCKFYTEEEFEEMTEESRKSEMLFDLKVKYKAL